MRKPKGYWTRKRCIAVARKYKSSTEFQKEAASAYETARFNGWLEACTAHMRPRKKPDGYWTKDRCIASAKRYQTRGTWGLSEESGAYSAARRNGWYEECVAHMPERANGRRSEAD